MRQLKALAKLKYMLTTFTANYTKIDLGYMGQLIEWQEVITGGETLELCRESLQPENKAHPELAAAIYEIHSHFLSYKIRHQQTKYENAHLNSKLNQIFE